MSELFEAIRGPETVDAAIKKLLARHEQVSRAGQRGLELQMRVEPGCQPDREAGWGTEMKRQRIEAASQPMAEVVNLCATVERLLDALAWAGGQLGPTAEVLLVHPGTSSSGGPQQDDLGRDVPDHDAVLWHDGQFHVFEVSDVASRSDNNGKTRKDLETLEQTMRASERGLLKGGGEGNAVRAYLVVSPERGASLRTRQPSAVPGDMKLQPVENLQGRTAVFELCYRDGISSE